jgi:signal transduction histidine kinase
MFGRRFIPIPEAAVRAFISRPLRLAVTGFLTILCLALAINGLLAFRAERRLERLSQDIAAAETLEERDLMDDTTQDLRSELRLEVGALTLLLGLGATIVVSTRRKILSPLRSLETLVWGLAQGERTPIPTEPAEPFLQPLFRNYNALVTRLGELEHEHRTRATSLEHEVRVATRALLEQQQSLARAERLTATGELAASVAHELRNPLASVQMALANMRREMSAPESERRIDLMSAELTRVNRLLGDILSKARHEPEPPRTIRLADFVEQLLGLVRYQLPPEIELRSDVPDELTCRLPQDALRQALLNLVLNAAQAMGDRAGTIRIGAEAQNGTLALSVSDDGTGFPQAILEDGVRPFSSTRDHGTGLGLAVVKRFVRDADGVLELENREPRGALVTLRLPWRRGA